jgi:Transposase DDE domain/Transposase domain (DUF772)
MTLRTTLSQIWNNVQLSLLPQQEEDLGFLSQKHKKLISILELVRIEEFTSRLYIRGLVGRPARARAALARAFVAKIVFKLEFTNQLRELLLSDAQLRRICGWESGHHIPSEATFSRVFNEFSIRKIPELAHEALIKDLYEDEIVGHVSKDSTPIEAREKVVKASKPLSQEKRNKKGRPKKGQPIEKKLTRIEKQALGTMTVEQMLEGLPTCCDYGKKKKPTGHHIVWKGYKLHAAVDDHCIPLAVILTSASVQDNQVAIPLAIKSDKLVKNLYDLMDSNYKVEGILEHSRSLGHVPIVETRPANAQQKASKIAECKRRKILNWAPAEAIRYKERGKSERFNALFKDHYGGRLVRYRGHLKASCHLMFGVLSLAALLLLDLVK